MGAITTSPLGVDYVGILDVSGWQFRYAGNGRLQARAEPPNYELAVARGIAGCIARIGNGTSLDESFALQWPSMREHLDGRGAYIYAQPNRLTGRQQAEQMARFLEPYADELTLPWMLDFEEYHGTILTPAAIGMWLDDCLTTMERLSGRPPLLYAGNAFMNPSTVAQEFADVDTMQPRYSRYGTPPIRVAEWADWVRWDRTPTTNRILGSWDGWQFSSTGDWRSYGGPVDAGTGNVDLNLVPLDTWRRWCRPTYIGGTMLDTCDPHEILYDGPAVPEGIECTIRDGRDGKAAHTAVVMVTVVSPSAPGHVRARQGDGKTWMKSSVGNFHTIDAEPDATPFMVKVDSRKKIGVQLVGAPNSAPPRARVIVTLMGVIT